MTLEATVLCVDTSEYLRNADYSPSRLATLRDALNLLGTAKLDRNPESQVAVIPAGSSAAPGMLSLTTDTGALLAAISSLRPAGLCDVMRGLKVAQLALKQRQNKSLQQRIVLFLCSPVLDEDAAARDAARKDLIKLGKRLKKNNVSLDAILFGEAAAPDSVTRTVMTELVDAVAGGAANRPHENLGGSSNCTLLIIEDTNRILSDAIISSPILGFGSGGDGGGAGGDVEMAGAGGGAGGAGGGNFAEYGGIDPSLDPELAMVMQMSLQEERERLARETAESASTSQSTTADAATANDTDAAASTSNASSNSSSSSSSSTTTTTTTATTTTTPAATPGAVDAMDDEGDDDELALALAMSLEQGAAKAGQEDAAMDDVDDMPALDDGISDGEDDQLAAALAMSVGGAAGGSAAGGADGMYEDDDDDEVALAIAMSMQQEQQQQSESGGSSLADTVASLPGVDPSDPKLQQELKKLADQTKKSSDKK